ncbi:MAG: M91 family zinc metallopeptidase [Gammaproteobacteria bacterium]
MCELGYMDIPGLYIRNGVSKINGVDFDDITDWGGTFIEDARKSLVKLKSGKNNRGKILVEGVSDLLVKAKRQVTIEPSTEFGGQGGSGWDEKTLVIRWCATAQESTTEDWDQLRGIPPFIILGHELIHALHTLTASTNYGHDRLTNNAIEETRTIGLGPWKDDSLTENGLRSEWGLKPRETFQGVGASKLLTGTKYLNL